MSLILLSVFLPTVSGILLVVSSFWEHLKAGTATEKRKKGSLKRLHLYVGIILIFTALLALAAAWTGEREITLFYLMKDIPIYFKVDNLGRFFVTFVSIVWVLAGIYSFTYMKHEGEEKRFFGCYITGLRDFDCTGFLRKSGDILSVL